MTKQLTKLTEAVFAMPECPTWAQFAAVDADGVAYWYDTAPELDTPAWRNISKHFAAKRIPLRYDRSDWQHSLVKRPVEDQPTKLTKLTEAVFSMPDCPTWAKYATVDSDGVVTVFDSVPHPTMARNKDTAWLPLVFPCMFQTLKDVLCDPTDCRNSVVRRKDAIPITTKELYKELRILMSDIELGSRSCCSSISMYKMEMQNINRNIRKCKQLVSKLQQLTEGEQR